MRSGCIVNTRPPLPPDGKPYPGHPADLAAACHDVVLPIHPNRTTFR